MGRTCSRFAARAGLAAISLVMGAMSTAGWAQKPAPSEDLIVVGRLENLTYDHVEDPEDILGHGWISAKFHVRRVLRGRAPNRTLQVRYFAHTYMREDRDFRLRLRKVDETTYVVCTEPPGDGARC